MRFSSDDEVTEIPSSVDPGEHPVFDLSVLQEAVEKMFQMIRGQLHADFRAKLISTPPGPARAACADEIRSVVMQRLLNNAFCNECFTRHPELMQLGEKLTDEAVHFWLADIQDPAEASCPGPSRSVASSSAQSSQRAGLRQNPGFGKGPKRTPLGRKK